MKFSVEPKIFERFPGVEIGVLVLTKLNNEGKSEEILKLLRVEEKKQKELLANVELGSLPEISGWRKIYRELGSNPKDFRSSVEALLRRARGGEKPIPQINNLVDLYNYISLKYHLPAGAEDLDKTEGDISLMFANGAEKGTYIGGTEIENCEQGEVIYKDEAGFICRRWNWREADRTKIDKETNQAVLVIERVPTLADEVLTDALKESEDLIKKILGGEVRVAILNSKSPYFNFEITKNKKRKDSSELKEIKKKELKKVKKKTDQKTSNPVSEILEKNPPFIDSVIRKIILKAVEESFTAVKLYQNAVNIEHPKVNNYGDYSTNLALIISGRLKMKPMDEAEKISRKISEYIKSGQMISIKADSNEKNLIRYKVSDILENVKSELPGFVNLFLAKKWLISQIDRVLDTRETVKQGQNPISEAISGQKIMVEFTDPNPFKELHIGHLYSNSVGESLCRIFEFFGADVKRANYFGDVGMHVAKSIWGLQKNLSEKKLTIEELEKRSLRDRVKFLGESYALGATAFEKESPAKEQMKDINYLVFLSAQKYIVDKFN